MAGGAWEANACGSGSGMGRVNRLSASLAGGPKFAGHTGSLFAAMPRRDVMLLLAWQVCTWTVWNSVGEYRVEKLDIYIHEPKQLSCGFMLAQHYQFSAGIQQRRYQVFNCSLE